MREAKAASICVREAVVKDEDAFLFDLLAADDIELARVLRVGLVLKRDVKEVAGRERERVHIGVAGGGERRKVRSAPDVPVHDGLLDALGEVDGLHRFAGLGARRRIRCSEIREHVMELRPTEGEGRSHMGQMNMQRFSECMMGRPN
jgi:hypothetical protein